MNDVDIIETLKTLVDEGKVRLDSDSLTTYGKDWTKMYEPKPRAIVFPKTLEQVQSLVRFAYEQDLQIVPSGGRTGLSAGAVAPRGEIVISMDYMNKILDFNPIDQTVRCQAGVVTEQLQQFAEEQDLFYPVDFASAGSSQLGGNIATNAGGIKVIRYGMTRQWVLGLKVVTGTGEVLDLNKGLVKNATGYDLRHLFIGSEGTLGLIVEATIKLARPPQNLTAMVLAVPEFSAIMSVLNLFQQRIDLTAFEFFSDKAMRKVLARGDVPEPFATEGEFYALIEFEASSEPLVEAAMELFEQAVEQGWVVDGVMSQSQQQLANLWRLREDISETISQWTPYKNDISVLVSRVPEFVAEIDAIVQQNYPDFEIIWFGHIGDGNVHLNILKPEDLSPQAFFEKCHHVSRWVFETVEKYQGSISAEHGVGMTKRDYLGYSRSAEEIHYMRAIKQAFDPKNIMNPGKLLDMGQA